MNEITKNKEKGIVHLLHGEKGKLSIPKPFQREIFLLDTHVAGTSYIAGIEELEPHLNIGDKLDLFREPDNLYDEKAILVKTNNGVKIGYLPRAHNEIISRLMDAGKLLFARITSKEWIGDWLKITISVFLQD